MYEDYYNKVNVVREGRGNGEELRGRRREAPAKTLKKSEKGRSTLDGTSLTIYARKKKLETK